MLKSTIGAGEIWEFENIPLESQFLLRHWPIAY